MKYKRQFKDEFIVHFDGDVVLYKKKRVAVYGTTGINMDDNIIQIRDDILLQEVKNKTFYSFDKLLLIWDSIHSQLIYIAKKKMLVHRNKS